MRALEGLHQREDDPTVTYLTAYLLTLYARYDNLARYHRQMIAHAEEAERRNRQLHVDLTTAQACAAALESRKVIVVEALKQAEDKHVQQLVEAYLVTHQYRRALRIQEPIAPTPVRPQNPVGEQILEGILAGTKGKQKAWEPPEGAIVLGSTPVSPRAMEEEAHPESSQVLRPDPDLEEPRTMKKIPVPTPSPRRKKEKKKKRKSQSLCRSYRQKPPSTSTLSLLTRERSQSEDTPASSEAICH